MSSFTSSSERRRRPARARFTRHARRAVLYLSAFACTAMVVLAAARWFDRSYPLMRLRHSEYHAGLPDVTEDTYLAARWSSLEYNAFTYNWDGVVDAARQADVLFLGNSRAVYGFRPEYFQPWLDRIGLRGYNMSFFGGGGFMPLWTIRQYDLRPKMVVINEDGFLMLEGTRWGEAARNAGAWRAFKDYYRSTAKWLLQKRLHQVVPPLRALTNRRGMVIYRRIDNGSLVFAFGESEGKPLGMMPPDEPDAATIRHIEQRIDSVYPVAAEFLEEMDRRGILVVLTFVQDNQYIGYFLAKRLNETHRRIFVESSLPTLMGQAGSHMDAASSERLMNHLMPKILALPEVKALAEQPARASGEARP